MDIFLVVISKKAEDNLLKVPSYLVTKLMSWVELVSSEGLSQARKIPGYHDEPLQGKRSGQRSIRLNKAYRAIYEVNEKGEANFVEILEVNKHEY